MNVRFSDTRRVSCRRLGQGRAPNLHGRKAKKERDYLETCKTCLNTVVNNTGFQRIAAIETLKNLINENDETRKRFEVMAREVFNKFKACLTMNEVSDYRAHVGAINIIYKSQQEDRAAADISSIIREWHLWRKR